MRMVFYGINSGPTMPAWAIHFDGHPYKTEVNRYLQVKDILDEPLIEADRALRIAIRKAKTVRDRWPFLAIRHQNRRS